MKGKNMYTDYESREIIAAEMGFSFKKFGLMVSYLEDTMSPEFAGHWSSMKKAEKREYCAKLVIRWSTSEKLKKKAIKFVLKQEKKEKRNKKDGKNKKKI